MRKLDDYLFVKYCKQLFKNLFFYLFIVVDVIGVYVGIIKPTFVLPQYIFIIIAFIFLIISGYRVYYDLYKLNSENIYVKPNVIISFIEGNNYSAMLDSEITGKKNGDFDLSYVYSSIKDTNFPNAVLSVNQRIENKSSYPINILSINGKIDILRPYTFHVPSIIDNEDTVIKYPVTLESKQMLNYIIKFDMSPNILLTEAEIAILVKDLINKEHAYKLYTKLEISYGDAIQGSMNKQFNISIRRICEELIKYWENNKKDNILRLIKGSK